jgi:putative transposase
MKARKRIKNMVDDCHRKAVKWLCSNYHVILLPKYETSNMVKKEDRNIGKKTARSMYTWYHYRFKQRLISKSKLYPNCKVEVDDESHTTITCGKCGHLNPSFSSKTFRCQECDFHIDRDWNGARNYLIKRLNALSLH